MFLLLVAVMTVLAWGSWIGVAESARSATVAGRTLRATIGNLGLAVAVAVAQVVTGHPFIRLTDLALPFLGGMLWAAGNYCAFRATAGLGIARAAGIWTSVNVLTALAWGAFVFHEFANLRAAVAARLALALVAVLGGLLLILRHSQADDRPRVAEPSAARDLVAVGSGVVATRTTVAVGGKRESATLVPVAAALGAGVLWGSYFIPIQAAGLQPAAANLPLAAGMVTGACLLAALTDRRLVRLRTRHEGARVLSAGVLWGLGNLGMLLLVAQLGAGRGFTIAQLGLIVNALIGIVAFHNPRPGSRAAAVTLAGVALAAIGGILVGQAR